MPWSEVDVVLLKQHPSGLCQMAYPGRPYGCPNFGARDTCPPRAKVWTPQSLRGFEAWAIWNKYDLGKREKELKAAHPEWTSKQCRCSRYWQGTARKQLREEAGRWSDAIGLQYGDFVHVAWVPEAHGVNVTETMEQIGVKLHWPPKRWTYQVAIALVR